jgi:hypothetical protein
MKILLLLLTLFLVLPGVAEARWAVANVTGGSPIFTGDRRTTDDQGPKAVTSCNSANHTRACAVVTEGDTGTCAGFANNGGAGSKLRWSIAEGSSSSHAGVAALRDCNAKYGSVCKMVRVMCQ